jgi:hypothetical protein
LEHPATPWHANMTHMDMMSDFILKPSYPQIFCHEK